MHASFQYIKELPKNFESKISPDERKKSSTKSNQIKLCCIHFFFLVHQSMMNSLIQSILLVCLIGSTWAIRASKECDIEKPIKNCLHMGLLFEPDTTEKLPTFSTDMAHLNKRCEELKKVEECSEDFINHCANNPYEERVLGHLFESSQRVFKRLCRINSRKQELLKHSPCANAVIDDTMNCIGDYNKLVYAANKLTDKNKILRILCCKIREVVPCVGEAMKSKGDSVCPQKSIDYWKDLRGKIKEEMTSIICADFDRDNCQNVEVPSVKDSEYKGKHLYDPMRDLYKKVLG